MDAGSVRQDGGALTLAPPREIDADSVAERGRTVRAAVAAVAHEFARDGLARGQRQTLDHADFAALTRAGFLGTGLPASAGGLWQGLRASVRQYAQLVRTIASGDPSVALVAAMHPLVLCYWNAIDHVADGNRAAWLQQQRFIYDTVRSGCWWGTITSEPGSNGDISSTRASATPVGGLNYLLTGEKHFGSGAGVASFMTTAARVVADDDPPTFFLDMRNAPWDGSRGMTMTRAWDGHGMSATQSHAFRFDRFPVTCIAAPDSAVQARAIMAPLSAIMFAAVAVAVVTLAMDYARRRVSGGEPRKLETAEWLRAESTAWLIEQAYEGAIGAAEGDDLRAAHVAALHAKLLIGELGEDLLLRLGRIVGGGSFSRGQPLGQWGQDIRALGFLRPPWGLAWQQLAAGLRAQADAGASQSVADAPDIVQ